VIRKGKLIENFRPSSTRGHPSHHSHRAIVNAICYLVRTGCQWRILPHEFPLWKAVYHYIRRLRWDGTWERIHSLLRRQVRQKAGRQPEPSAAILDSQSVKATEVSGVRGYDAVKKSMDASGIRS